MKKRTFSIAKQITLVGAPIVCKKEVAPVADLIRRDIKEFGMSVAEIATLCAANHIFPYDLLPGNQALADKVIDELVRQRDGNTAVDERVK